MKRRWMALFMALAMLLSSVVACAAEPLAEKFADTEKIATEIYTEGETAWVLYSPDGSISMRLCLEEDGSLTYGRESRRTSLTASSGSRLAGRPKTTLSFPVKI